MVEPLRFKIDENLPNEVAEMFRAAGFDALTVADQGLSGAEDPRVATVCREELRILITLDAGFGDIRSYPPGSHPGLVVLRLGSQEKPLILDVVSRLIPLLGTTSIRGTLWIVDERRVRVRG